ncbi:hypothetical protein SPONL_1284 [uncultured Candidatus Thioglobus sp.]|nr:hypothetical protein SPONL_1284 [uncultured Candidatus Thioglobus sp.]
MRTLIQTFAEFNTFQYFHDFRKNISKTSPKKQAKSAFKGRLTHHNLASQQLKRTNGLTSDPPP